MVLEFFCHQLFVNDFCFKNVVKVSFWVSKKTEVDSKFDIEPYFRKKYECQTSKNAGLTLAFKNMMSKVLKGDA